MSAVLADIPPLYTPEELEAHFGKDHEGKRKFTAWEMREMVRKGKVDCTRLGRGKIAFTPDQVSAMLAARVERAEGPSRPAKPKAPEVAAAEALGFRTSKRQRK
ncbi:hypothetical protein [Nesterenkonia rhizosphaerae]|uniref:Helix-turn-helix domain-containing protein n=1 Tax=Nesterenkonia rhizosphaerae TaxID=1348272 RepID=A0ABP9FT09_9MICC